MAESRSGGAAVLGEIDADGQLPFYKGKDAARPHPQQQGVLERLQSLNPFKKGKVGGGWFNPEDFTALKREWSKHYGVGDSGGEAHKLFESFLIAGLPPSTDIKSVTADAQTTKTARQDHVPMRFAPEAKKETEHRGSKGKPLPAQVLYSYPADKAASGEVAAFCFPHGVQPTLLERTPSMSNLNEIVYSQQFLHSDAHSFIFLMKVADNRPLYGICCYMEEMVHRPPAILSHLYPDRQQPLSRHLVTAPRCYCFLTHHPFFSLHMKVLHMIMGLERLERITSFADDYSPREGRRHVPDSPFQSLPPVAGATGAATRSPSQPQAKLANGPSTKSLRASPVSSGPERLRTQGTSQALAAAIKSASTSSSDQAGADGLLESPAVRRASFNVPPPATRPLHRKTMSAVLPPVSPSPAGPLETPARIASSVSRASARLRQVLDAKAEAHRGEEGVRGEDSNGRGGDTEAGAVETSSDSSTSYQTAWSQLIGTLPPDESRSATCSPERMRHSRSTGALARLPASASPLGDAAPRGPPGNGMTSPQSQRMLKSHSFRPAFGPDGTPQSGEPAGALQVVRAYHEAAVPAPGEELEFRVDDSLQPIHFRREPKPPQHAHRSGAAAAEAEAAAGLRGWSIVVLCRCLSLDNVLLLLTAVLLEQQVVLFCPNVGLLSTAVLAMVPLIRPFAWQSLMLPILPALDNMLDLLEAPVPFIAGVQYKTSEVASRCGGLIRVNVYKDSIKNAEKLPALPGRSALHAMLQPAYELLRGLGAASAHSRPTFDVNGGERQAAEDFLQTMEAYLRSLCSCMHLHAITDVQTADRVSLLLKDSFVESFAQKDRGFMRAFVETQMFSVYCDTVM